MKNDANPDDVNNLNNLRRNENHKYCDDQWSDNTRVVAGWFGSTRAWKPPERCRSSCRPIKQASGSSAILALAQTRRMIWPKNRLAKCGPSGGCMVIAIAAIPIIAIIGFALWVGGVFVWCGIAHWWYGLPPQCW